MVDNQSVAVDVKRRRCSCGQFVLLFDDLIVASYVRRHYIMVIGCFDDVQHKCCV